jgi:hypothetical protein
MYPKFIIETDPTEGDCLIIAKCTYHRQLAIDISKVKGGGWWSLDKEKSTFTLTGESHDFGKAQIEDIAKCIQREKVFRSLALIEDISHQFEFYYRDIYGELIDLKTYKIDE